MMLFDSFEDVLLCILSTETFHPAEKRAFLRFACALGTGLLGDRVFSLGEMLTNTLLRVVHLKLLSRSITNI